MAMSLLFWVVLLFWALLGLAGASHGWPAIKAQWQPVSWSLILFVLILLLGWATFGPPIK